MTALVGGSWEALVWRCYKPSSSSSSSSRSLYDDLVCPGVKILLKVFYKSLREDLVVKCCQKPLHDLVKYRSLWQALEEALVKSCRCLYMIWYRSWWKDCVWRSRWNPPQEALALRSWRSSGSSALVYVSKFFWDAHGKFLYEDLVNSSIQIYIEGPAAAASIMSNLIGYCSIATVACILHIDFLLPTLFGVSCRCNLFRFLAVCFLFFRLKPRKCLRKNLQKNEKDSKHQECPACLKNPPKNHPEPKTRQKTCQQISLPPCQKV